MTAILCTHLAAVVLGLSETQRWVHESAEQPAAVHALLSYRSHVQHSCSSVSQSKVQPHEPVRQSAGLHAVFCLGLSPLCIWDGLHAMFHTACCRATCRWQHRSSCITTIMRSWGTS